jgi:hypothetical protein
MFDCVAGLCETPNINGCILADDMGWVTSYSLQRNLLFCFQFLRTYLGLPAFDPRCTVWGRHCSPSHYYILLFVKVSMGSLWLERPSSSLLPVSLAIGKQKLRSGLEIEFALLLFVKPQDKMLSPGLTVLQVPKANSRLNSQPFLITSYLRT